MNAKTLIQQLENQQVHLSIEKDDIVINAPKGILNSSITKQLKQHKNEILERLQYHNLTKSEIRDQLTPTEWSELQNNTNLLKLLAQAMAENNMRLQGIVPPNYTATTFCSSCNKTVFIPPELCNNGLVLGCPWCFTRMIKPITTTH